MKHNPRINEEIARTPGFAQSHPLQPDHQVQGNLELMWWLEQTLKEIFGMPRVTLQPVAGAHGELTGILMVHKALAKSGNARKYILIPDSAHGTNPASTALAGYEVIEVKSDAEGRVDLGDLERHLGPDVAAFMITVPNTLGNFEPRVVLHRARAERVETGIDGDVELRQPREVPDDVDLGDFNFVRDLVPHQRRG